jgi:hypothetical protein
MGQHSIGVDSRHKNPPISGDERPAQLYLLPTGVAAPTRKI